MPQATQACDDMWVIFPSHKHTVYLANVEKQEWHDDTNQKEWRRQSKIEKVCDSEVETSGSFTIFDGVYNGEVGTLAITRKQLLTQARKKHSEPTQKTLILSKSRKNICRTWPDERSYYIALTIGLYL